VSARWLLLLLVAAGACAPAAERAASAHDQARRDLERGDLQRAEQAARHQQAAWSDPRSPWHWRFRLLAADVLIAQGKAADALALAGAAVTAGEDAAALEAQRLKVRGHAALNLGRYDEAAALLEEASRRAAAASLPRLGLEIDVLRGLLLIRTNRQEAGETITRAAHTRAVAQGDHYWQAAAANNLGIERLRAFHYDEAIPYLEQALKAAESVGAQRFAAASLANLGTCYYRIGDFDKALSFLERAAGIQERIGAMVGLQSSLGDIGNVHVMQGHPDRALPFYQRALALARERAPWDSAKWAGNLAVAHAELKQWDQAERFNREALALRQENSDADSIAYSKLEAAEIASGRGQHQQAIALYEETIGLAGGNAELVWDANAGLATAHLRLGSPARASVFFERCLQSIDEARVRLSRSDYKLTFFARLIRFYQAYVDVLVAQGQHEKALQVADSSRALLLSEKLQLREDRRALVTRRSLQQTARRLKVVILSYWLAPERSFVWAIDARSFSLIELPGRDRIDGLIGEYRAFLETSLRDPIAAGFQPARELYHALIGPAHAFVPPGSHVLIVPDGSMHALNVETLPVPADRPRYFIEDATVTIAPALALVLTSTPPQLSGAPALLIGDPEAAGTDFPRLPDAGREIRAIRERFGDARVTELTGTHATPAAYESSRPERFGVIHFAAHATANRASPLDSSVVLSPHAGRYMLSARDVLNHPLRAELVTISACRSAGATVYGGEGIVGFAWAFLQTGARRVIAGLWDVTDRSTFTLMDAMYAGLEAGRPPATALRDAKLALLRGGHPFSRPYFWGPFQLYLGGGMVAQSRRDGT
jgi:CHAT domain-containing protein